MTVATVCAWRETGADAWRCGPVRFAPGESDGAGWLFGLLADGSPEAYAEFAEDYWERPVDVEAVRAVLTGATLTPGITKALSPTADFALMAKAVRALGHPVHP
ncbi:hypothetical protein ABTZ78_28290 [Streptomyces bauhiniae]|uniref:hypothetical protein n=1 Tax=Streptomyces bauhiniae TaxID=2340725 RepID=UPI0033345AAA